MCHLEEHQMLLKISQCFRVPWPLLQKSLCKTAKLFSFFNQFVSLLCHLCSFILIIVFILFCNLEL